MTSSKPGPRQVPPPAGGNARANAYARFIPREELAGFANWTPDAFGHANRPGIGRPEPEPPPPAEHEPDAAEWLGRIDEARQAGYQDGYRDGLQALEAAKRQNAQQISAQVAALLASVDDQLQGLETRMADAVVDTALRLARQVVRTELSLQPAAVVAVASEAVQAVMLSARHLRLRLHPEDLTLVEAGATDLLQARSVLLQADLTLQRGGCVVESDLGQVDARIEQRWAQAAAVFGAPGDWPAAGAADAPDPLPGEAAP
jgi:flagellar assembly protein FliH